MQIKLVKVHFNGTYSYKYRPFEYCCSGIQSNKNIILTDKDFVDYDEEYADDECFSIPQFCTTSTEVETSYDDSWEVQSSYPIQYCPHCGEKINIEVAEEIDLSTEYSKLENERKSLFLQANKTDSKKKEAELRRKVWKLDQKINWFYQLAELEGDYDEEKI